jgi:hypothetical protein
VHLSWEFAMSVTGILARLREPQFVNTADSRNGRGARRIAIRSNPYVVLLS